MSDTSALPVSVDVRRDLYRAAISDPDWAVRELLTVAVGTLRALTIPNVHPAAEARKRATEAIAEIDHLVAKKLSAEVAPDAG